MLIEQFEELQKKVEKTANKAWKDGNKDLKKIRKEVDKRLNELAKEGRSMQKKVEKDRKKAVAIVLGGLETGRDYVETAVSDRWNQAQKTFEEAFARLLERLDVPTSEDIQVLAKQVNALSRQVSNLRKQKGKS
ncbi:MAG: phasin family protein [Xanthomonadales bacterium]|nr:phasin family protein [Xanthomonadales bacterium]